MHKTGGDVEPSAHSAGQGLDSVLCSVGEVHQLQDLVHSLLQPTAGEPVETAEEAQVLPGAEVLIERHFLGHEADQPLGTGGPARPYRVPGRCRRRAAAVRTSRIVVVFPAPLGPNSP